MLKIAVLADLHTTSDTSVKDPGGSFLSTSAPENQQAQHPLMDLERLCRNDPSLRADLIVCPGDLTNNADPAPLNYAWAKLHLAKSWFGARHVLATVGNHDVVSRGYKLEKNEHLKALTPSFPGATADSDHYWANHFCIVDESDWRVVTLNTCAYHGLESEEEGIRRKEYERGRIETTTLTKLLHSLSKSARIINVLVCHHHPLKHAEHGLGEHDEIAGGQLLLDALASGDHGRWLLIHGHKHHPKLQYGPGGSASPIVFSAGSFSKKLYPELATHCRNQFYLLTVEPGVAADVPSLKGTFRSWTWRHGSGWCESVDREGLPSEGGFGYDIHLPDTVDAIMAHVPNGISKWADLLLRMPHLRYTIPSDLHILRRVLVQRGIDIEAPEGIPMRLIKL